MSYEDDEKQPCAPCDDCGMHADCCGEPHDVGMCVCLDASLGESDEEGQ